MKQPKLSVKNHEIVALYRDELSIPLGKNCSSTIIGRIGDPYTTKRTGTEVVPLALYQRRSDVGSNTGNADPQFAAFTGLGGFDRILKHIQTVTKEAFDAQNLQEGMVIANAHIALDRSTEPFYQKSNGEDQDPIVNPSTNQKVTFNGELVYDNTRLAFGEVEHLGSEIVYDEQEVVEVETEEASLELEEEF